MTEPLHRRAIADGVWFSRIHDPKFYHNSISVTLITPLTEGKTSAAVLAAYYGKSRAENTRGGITYDAALGRDESC